MYSKIAFLLIVATLLCTSLQAQLAYKWSQTIGSPEGDLNGQLHIDDDGNLYTLNQLRDTADLDPGAGTDIIFPLSSSVLVLHKSDAAGNYLWGGRFRTLGTISGRMMEVDHGHIRLSVSFTDSLTYTLHDENRIAYYSPGQHTCILKLTLDGAVLEADYFAAPSFYFNDLYTLPSGFTLMTGAFVDTMTFPGATHLISEGDEDPFFILLNSNKAVVWAISFGSSEFDYVGDIRSFGDEAFYFPAYYEDTIVMITLDGIKTFPDNGEGNSLVFSMNLQGQITHAFALTNEKDNEIDDLIIDKDENIYVCGDFDGEINFAHPSQAPAWYDSNENNEGFIAKYTREGLLKWVNVYTSTKYSYMNNLVLERDTDLYFTGGTTGRSDLDPGPGSMIVEADHHTDLVLGKLQLDGTQTYIYHFEGNSVEGITSLIVSDARSEVIISGFYYTTLDCDFTEDEKIIVSAGGSDNFRIVFDEENVVTSVGSPVSAIEHTLFPNPASTHIQFESVEPVDFVSIHAIDGQLIRMVQMDQATTGEVDVRDLVPGLYCVTLHAKDKVMANKIEVQ